MDISKYKNECEQNLFLQKGLQDFAESKNLDIELCSEQEIIINNCLRSLMSTQNELIQVRDNQHKKASTQQKKLLAAEGAFYECFCDFVELFNEIHSKNYFQHNKLCYVSAKIDPNFRTVIYNRDKTDRLISDIYASDFELSQSETIAATVLACDFFRGDLGITYIDIRNFVRANEGRSDSLTLTQMLPVALSEALTKDARISKVFRAPLPAKERQIRDTFIEAALLLDRDADNIDTNGMLKDAERKLRISEDILAHSFDFFSAVKMQTELLDKENDSIIRKKSNNFLKEDQKQFDNAIAHFKKTVYELENTVFGFADVKKAEQMSVFEIAEKAMKKQYAFENKISPALLPKNTFRETLNRLSPQSQRAKDKGKDSAKNSAKAAEKEAEKEDSAQKEIPGRVKTDVVKKMLAKERAKIKRELSPNPALSKTKQLNKSKALGSNQDEDEEDET